MRNDYVITFKDNSDSFKHHGILGQKWGIRRFQNEDGTLTEAGKTRYKMNLQLFAKPLPTIKITNKEEYAKALKAFRDAVALPENRDRGIVEFNTFDYIYRAENHFDNVPRFVYKKRIPGNSRKLSKRLNDEL